MKRRHQASPIHEKETIMRNVVLALPLLAALTPAAAMAHVTATPNQGVAGGYLRTTFAITHGCDGSATVAVRIRLPEDVIVARPQAKPGWSIEIRKEKLAAPVSAGHGRTSSERVAEIEWRGGRLDDAHYDEFGLSLKLPEGSDRKLWFAVTQICEKGSNEWTQIPPPDKAWNSVPFPAPFIILLPPPAPSGSEHKH